MHLMYKALSERFGFKVSWRNAPPYRYKAFGTWCRRNGVDPATGRPLEGATRARTSPHTAVPLTAVPRTAIGTPVLSPRSRPQCPIAGQPVTDQVSCASPARWAT